MKDGNIKILKKIIRQRRAISSNIWENGSYNESEEERNKSKNSIKSFHHRKTTSSFFCGSYLSSNLENELLNNLNIDELYNEQNKDEKDESLLKKEKFSNSENIFNSNINQENNYDSIFNVSFHSYEFDNSNNNSDKVRTEENANNNKSNSKNNTSSEINNSKNIKNKKDKKIFAEKEIIYNTEKSFVSFKNNLKYIKDKEERATQSYLLALGMTIKQNKKEEKEQYLPTASVIEEEKSDLIESKSEFSNKKKNSKNSNFSEDSLNNGKNKVCFIKKDTPKLKAKNCLDEINQDKKIVINGNINNNLNDISNRENGGIKNNFININKNYKYIIEEKKDNEKKFKGNEKISVKDALNDIINKNNKKKENKRRFLKKNKIILLNSFFNLTFKGKKSKMNENDIKDELKRNNKNIFKKTENNNKEEKSNNKIEKKFPFLEKKKKIENSYISNIIKRRYNTENNSERMTKNNNIIQNKENTSKCILNRENINIRKNHLNNSINSNLNADFNNSKNKTFNKEENNKPIKTHRAIITKIEYRPRSRIPHLRQKIIERKDIMSNNIDSMSINKNSVLNKKYLSKIVNIPHKKTHSFTKEKIILNGKDNYNLHSMKQIKTINEALTLIRIDRLNSKNKIKNYSKKLNKSIYNKNSNSSSFTGGTRSNSKSSCSKEKNVMVCKANSGTLNYRNTSFNLLDENIVLPGNKQLTIFTLKENLIYSKSYIKINALEKIAKTFNSYNSFFIIFCEKYIKVEKNSTGNNNNYNLMQNENFILLFKSLMKYYKNQNRFIKIYGDENAPNVISVKNIDIKNYYIYQTKFIEKQNKEKDKEKNDNFLTFELINELKFTTNAIILCKK